MDEEELGKLKADLEYSWDRSDWMSRPGNEPVCEPVERWLARIRTVNQMSDRVGNILDRHLTEDSEDWVEFYDAIREMNSELRWI